ncbi:hypothetical protein QN372_00905 [Undibacterium sp. RTI2.1]|uniref:hypothetical protein n=1 Tax=unclassified Undibacterium TaxID=2630295 RepID=UPI002AB4B800|nr:MULTISPECIES: hypothetical protein [unclassified Undibacterium]MDY7537696.1 hypothetical protein [Undibacterium sp. 5I1]MEB0029298.1 hypothetical protein [Undibacterium sp. RTI2.1]MEB0115606.1 hypothetical protein [Undibacterium sp. RTI2.2]MEB0256433.1 hypothetical protein [Undibacterium sp. 5I1]
MFVANISGKESINTLAASIGCKAGEALKGASGYGRPGLIGNTFPIKDALKAAGAKFDGENKAWIFESWADLEAVLNSVSK